MGTFNFMFNGDSVIVMSYVIFICVICLLFYFGYKILIFES